MFGLFENKRVNSNTQATELHTCCFGKMPMHADFIRYNVTSSRETSSFEKWLQEGVGCITRRHPKGWPPVYSEFSSYHFVLSGGDLEENLLGSLISSRDKSGRNYPFATLAVACAPILHTHRATLPLVYRNYFNASAALLQRSWKNCTVTTLINNLEDLPTENHVLPKRNLLAQKLDLLAATPMKLYWKSIQDSVPPEHREQFWCTFYNVMRTVINRGPSQTYFGIRLPLPGENDQIPFVLFWVQMVESILDDRFWRAHYFWSRGKHGNNPSLTLFFRPPPPSYLLPLLNEDLADNAIFNIGREWSSLTCFQSRGDLQQLLASNRTSMLDVLYKTGRREML